MLIGKRGRIDGVEGGEDGEQARKMVKGQSEPVARQEMPIITEIVEEVPAEEVSAPELE